MPSGLFEDRYGPVLELLAPLSPFSFPSSRLILSSGLPDDVHSVYVANGPSRRKYSPPEFFEIRKLEPPFLILSPTPIIPLKHPPELGALTPEFSLLSSRAWIGGFLSPLRS